MTENSQSPLRAPTGREKKRQGNMGILTIVNQLDEKFGVVRGRWVVGVVVIGWGNDFGGYCCHRERRSVGGLLGFGTVYGVGDALINHGTRR